MNATPEIIEGKELQQLLAKGCCLIDVREPVEHAEERIVGAHLIPLGQLEKRLGEIATDVPVVVMCRGGMRGEQARKILQSHGLSQVRNLQGGIMAWKASGLPVENGVNRAARRAASMPGPLSRTTISSMGDGGPSTCSDFRRR